MIFNNIKRQTGININAENTSLSFIPGIGIEFESAKIKVPGIKSAIILGKTHVKLSLLSLLFFSPSVYFGTSSYEGYIEGTISGIPINPMRGLDQFDLDVQGENIQVLSLLNNFFPLSVESKVNLKIKGTYNIMNYLYSNLKIESELSKLKVSSGTVMGIPVPDVSVNKGIVSVSLENSNININEIKLGKPGDDIDLFAKGSVKLKFRKPYNIIMKLKLSGKMEQQFGQFLSFGPLAKIPKSNGYISVRLKGDSQTPIPFIEPVN